MSTPVVQIRTYTVSVPYARAPHSERFRERYAATYEGVTISDSSKAWVKQQIRAVVFEKTGQRSVVFIGGEE